MLFGEKKTVIGKAEATIAVPKVRLFDLMGKNFMSNYQQWSPEVKELELLTPPPLQVGSLVRQVRVDHGHKSESTFKVHAFDPEGTLFFHEVDHKYHCGYRLRSSEENPEQTLVEFSFEFPDLELFMRPFEKLIRIAVQDGAVQTVKNLKKFAEQKAKA